MQDEGAPLFSFVHLANFSGAFTICQDAEMSDGRQGLLHRCAFVRQQTKGYLHPETGCLQLAGAFYFAKSFPKGGFQIVSSQTFFQQRNHLGIAFLDGVGGGVVLV